MTVVHYSPLIVYLKFTIKVSMTMSVTTIHVYAKLNWKTVVGEFVRVFKETLAGVHLLKGSFKMENCSTLLYQKVQNQIYLIDFLIY